MSSATLRDLGTTKTPRSSIGTFLNVAPEVPAAQVSETSTFFSRCRLPPTVIFTVMVVASSAMVAVKVVCLAGNVAAVDRKSTRLNSSH